jgi:hypothetical protein
MSCRHRDFVPDGGETGDRGCAHGSCLCDPSRPCAKTQRLHLPRAASHSRLAIRQTLQVCDRPRRAAAWQRYRRMSPATTRCSSAHRFRENKARQAEADRICQYIRPFAAHRRYGSPKSKCNLMVNAGWQQKQCRCDNVLFRNLYRRVDDGDSMLPSRSKLVFENRHG